jgi:hypothetical protein
VLSVAVSATLNVAATAQRASVAANVSSAIIAFVDRLPIGAILPLTRISQVAYAADPAVLNVSQVQINGTSVDATPPPTGVIKAESVILS